MDIQPAKNYAESRTGRGDKWFDRITELRDTSARLRHVAEEFEAYRMVIYNANTTLLHDQTRDLVRDEIMAFCDRMAAKARAKAVRDTESAQRMEDDGVE